MLHRLPDSLWDRISGHLNSVIHTAGAAAMAFSGLSLEQMALIVPAIISGLISVLAFVLKFYDTRRRRRIYHDEERRRTEAIEKYLNNLGTKTPPTETAALVVTKVSQAAAKVKEGIV